MNWLVTFARPPPVAGPVEQRLKSVKFHRIMQKSLRKETL
jgi:hypothetical protein